MCATSDTSRSALVEPTWLARWTNLFVDNLESHAVFALDLSGVILTWQPGVGRVFGYEREAFVGQPAALIFTETDRRAGAPERELNVALQEGQATDERWHLRADGNRFWGSGVMLALRDETGNTLGFVKLVRDRTQERVAGEVKTLETLELADSVETQDRQIQALATDLTLAEQRERQRISQLLHDDLQQQLYALQLLLRGIQVQAPPELTERLTEAFALTKASFATTRTLVSELNPVASRGGSFDQALTWLAEHMRQRYQLELHVSGHEHCPELPPALDILLFQCLQELIFNVVKHAAVGQAKLTVTRPRGDFQLELTDEGQGFVVAPPDQQPPRQEGFGLYNVQRRLEPFGGVVRIRSQPGDGTRVTITLPID